MAPGACGSRLANQCESTSGTSLGQTISLSAHSACCQTPVPFRPVPKQAGTPWAAVHAHTSARHFPKHSQSSWHLGMLSPSYPPTCSTNIPEGQRAAGAGAARLSTCLIGVRGGGTRSGRDTDAVHHVCATCSDYLTAFHPRHRSFLMRFNRLPSLNRPTSIWILPQADEDAIVEFPSLCFCYTVPVYESILALDSTEHTCWGECQAKEHLLWSVAVGKLFHFDKMACGITMA